MFQGLFGKLHTTTLTRKKRKNKTKQKHAIYKHFLNQRALFKEDYFSFMLTLSYLVT